MHSIVEYYSDPNPRKYSCGYCKKKSAYNRYGMWARILTVEDYQSLIDRGWRRSGSYCYKPINSEACCPMYTIRCKALEFIVSKSQKKIMRKVAKFLKDGIQDDKKKLERIKNRITPNDVDIGDVIQSDYKEHLALAQSDVFRKNEILIESESMDSSFIENNPSSSTNTVDDCGNSKIKSMMEDIPDVSQNENNSLKISTTIINNKNTNAHSRMSECDDTLPKKAKLIRIERARNKLLSQGKTLEEIELIYKKKKEKNRPKNIEEFFDSQVNGKNKLELKLVRVSSDEFMQTLDESVELFKKYQMSVHNSEPCECDKKSFLNFLGKSPLHSFTTKPSPPAGYGSFHQQYWLNNKLMAVGVIDILPYCVSSVYFFYDPAYSFLSLGTYSSLVEVRLTRELNKSASELKYYYMGYYIHSIPKMRYKAKIRPSYLLCSDTFKWFDIDRCIAKLNENQTKFNDNPNDIDEDGQITPDSLMQVGIYYRGRRLYGNVRLLLIDDENDYKEVKEYTTLVGKKCAYNMCLVRD